MSDNATPNSSAGDEHQPPASVVDARTGEEAFEPAPASAGTHELIESGDALESTGETAESEAVAPAPAAESEADAAKPKKTRARAKVTAGAEPDAEADDEPAAVNGTDADGSGADAPAPAEESAEPPVPESKKRWYAIKVQSGREDTIKAAILRKVAIEGLEDVFGQIMIPVDKVIEKRAVKVKDKKTGEYTTQEKKIERKVKKFQGYIFAELEFNDRLLYLIRETSGVGDFLKLRPRPNDTPLPEPMSDAEVKQMLGEKVGPEKGGGNKVKIEFEKGDRVRIREGSFKDSEGEVKDIILPKDPTDPPKIIVEVTFWGRPVPVDLEYWQVAKV